MASQKAKIRAAEKLFKKGREKAKSESGFSEIPDGKYIGRLVKMEPGLSQASERLQVAMGVKILDGEYAGETARKYAGIENEDQIAWFAKDLARLGYELPDSFEELESLCQEITSGGLVVRFQLKTNAKSDFQNLYFDKVLDGERYDEEVEPGDSDEDEGEEGLDVGDECMAPFDGDMYHVKITEWDGDDVTVVNIEDDSDEWTVKQDELQELEDGDEEEDEEEEAESDEDEEEDESEDEEEEAEVEVDSVITARVGRRKITGTVTEFSEDGEEVTFVDDDGEEHTTPVEKILEIHEDE